MPQLNGIEVLAEIDKIVTKETLAILISGHFTALDSFYHMHSAFIKPVCFFPKPFNLKDMKPILYEAFCHVQITRRHKLSSDSINKLVKNIIAQNDNKIPYSLFNNKHSVITKDANDQINLLSRNDDPLFISILSKLEKIGVKILSVNFNGEYISDYKALMGG